MRAWRIVVGGLVAPLGRLLFGPAVTGTEHVPAGGGAVLAFNHDWFLDAFLVVQATTRPVRFIGAAEVLRWPLVGAALRSFGAIPIERGRGDLAALASAVEAARGGDLVGIFPEGQLVPGRALGRIRRGAARIALEAGVPIVPVAIGGHLIHRRRPRFVTIGEPLAPAGDVDELTERLRKALQALVVSAFDE